MLCASLANHQKMSRQLLPDRAVLIVLSALSLLLRPDSCRRASQRVIYCRKCTHLLYNEK